MAGLAATLVAPTGTNRIYSFLWDTPAAKLALINAQEWIEAGNRLEDAAAALDEGGTLFFPTGVYRLKGRIAMAPNQRLHIVGSHAEVANGAGIDLPNRLRFADNLFLTEDCLARGLRTVAI